VFFTAPANWRLQQWGKAYSYYRQNSGGKGKVYLFMARYIDCGAASTVLTVHAGTIDISWVDCPNTTSTHSNKFFISQYIVLRFLVRVTPSLDENQKFDFTKISRQLKGKRKLKLKICRYIFNFHATLKKVIFPRRDWEFPVSNNLPTCHLHFRHSLRCSFCQLLQQ
jgi:hypothetical protein